MSRHGLEKKLYVAENAEVPTLEYAGVSTDGKGLKVSIQGDQIRINLIYIRTASGSDRPEAQV